MPTVFKPAQDVDREILDTMERVLRRHPRFEPLIDNEVKIEVLMAYNDKGPAIKLAKCAVTAKIKVVGAEERSRGGPDVRILVDGKRYAALGPKSRDSMFAHELYHLKLQFDDHGVVTDDYGRPKLTTIPDDWLLGGFTEVANWYGEDSLERRFYKALSEILGQRTLPFPDDDEPAAKAKEKPERAAAKTKPRAVKASASRASAKAEAPKSPEDLVRSVLEGLAAFEPEQVKDFRATRLDTLELPDLFVSSLAGGSLTTIDHVLTRVEDGFFLDRLPGSSEARAAMLADRIAAAFGAWSETQLHQAAGELEGDVAAVVKDVEDRKAAVNAMFPRVPIEDVVESDAEPDWREITIDELGLPEELVADAREYQVETAGSLDDWLRSGDSDDLHDESRELFIKALDVVMLPNLICSRCDFVRPGDVDPCTRCGAKSAQRTAQPVSSVDELTRKAIATAAEHSDLDIYGNGPRETSKPGHLRIGSKDVPVNGKLTEDDDKPKRQRKPKPSPSSAADDLYTVSQHRKKVPLYLVRASSLREAVDYVKGQHPATAKLDVKAAPLDFDPKGFITHNAKPRAATAV